MPSQALLSVCTFLCYTYPPQAGATPPRGRAYVQRSTLDSVQVYEDTAVMQPTALYHCGQSTVPLCVSSQWAFLHKHNIQLSHDITLTPFRSGDIPLMRFFYSQNLPIDRLFRLNKCSLYLNIMFLSELFNLQRSIKEFVMQGQPGPVLNEYLWPR